VEVCGDKLAHLSQIDELLSTVNEVVRSKLKMSDPTH
jgi:hypothetical protein